MKDFQEMSNSIQEMLEMTKSIYVDYHNQEKVQSAVSENELPIKIERAAQITGLAIQTIYQQTSRKRRETYVNPIPFHRIGGRLRFFEYELLQWIKNPKPTPLNPILYNS